MRNCSSHVMYLCRSFALSVRVRRRWAHKHVRCILILMHYGGVFEKGTCRHMKKKKTFARLIQANMAPSFMLPPCCLRASWGVLLLLLSSRASSQHEGLVTCCNLAYFESSSFALLRRHQQSQTERDAGPAEAGRSRADTLRRWFIHCLQR